MEHIDKKDSYEMIKENYKSFGYYANATRTLASDVDGMKSVYRRTLWTALEYPKGKMVKSAVLVGAVLKLHPHGEQSGVLYSLVNSKLKLFDKQGNFGSSILAGSATRYTECRYNDNALLYLGQDLVNHCEMVEGDLGYMEPRFLPALIPYILVEGNSSMGVGVSSSIPSLDVLDLVKFYRAGLTGTYKEVKLDIGCNRVKCSASDMTNLAVHGKISGVRFGCKVSVEGNSIVFTDIPPNMKWNKIYQIFSEAVDKELVDYRDESNAEIRWVFEVVKGKVETYLEQISKLSSTCSYDIVMTGSYGQEGQIVYTSLTQMREKTLTYLKECTVRKFKSEIDKLTRKLNVSKVILYMKDNDILKDLPKLDKSELKKILPFDSDSVDSALQQSISRLMKGVSSDEISSMEKELDDLNIELSNPERYVLKLYNDYIESISSIYVNKTSYEDSENQKNSNYLPVIKDNNIEVLEGSNETEFTHAIMLYPSGWIKTIKLNLESKHDTKGYVGYTLVKETDTVMIVCNDRKSCMVFSAKELIDKSEGSVLKTKNAMYIGVVGEVSRMETGETFKNIEFTYPTKSTPWDMYYRYKSRIVLEDKNFVKLMEV